MGGEAAESPLKPLADLREMAENRVNEALLDILPGNLISEIVEGKVREFIHEHLDAMIEEAVQKRFNEAMTKWLQDRSFSDRINEVAQGFIAGKIPRERIEDATERRVASFMGDKVDGMIESTVAKKFQECIDNWAVANLTEVEFGDKYEEIVGEIAKEYARGMGQNLMTNVMHALRMVGGGVVATANAQLGVHDKMVECPNCHMLLGDKNGSGVECPNCKQYVY